MEAVEKKPITLDHIRQAAEWAKTAESPAPIGGETRRYRQSQWDCGTSCCMWGAASILAGNGPAANGPPDGWATDAKGKLVVALLRSGCTVPQQVIDVLDNADLRGADLSGADLSDADLSDADLSDADLSDADLSDADLRDADLRGANLRGADLSGADLSGADLRGADLSGADLRGADLSDADLRDALVRVGNVAKKLM